MIYDDVVDKVFFGGLTCPCGGPIRKGVLSGARERWRCDACGRYEVMNEKNSDLGSFVRREGVVRVFDSDGGDLPVRGGDGGD